MGTRVLKGAQVVVCGMPCIDLNNNILKILGTQFSYNKKWKLEKILYKAVTDIERVLKIWKMINLTPEGKIKLNSNVKNCFPIITYNNCPKTYCEQT